MIATALFSRPAFRALASTTPRLRPAAREELAKAFDSASRLGAAPQRGAALADAYTAAYRYLERHYRDEYYFKAQLVSRIVFGRHSPRTANALLEFPMGSAIADLVVVNGTSTVYEIKTDLDNFDRLDAQIEQYRTRAEYVNVVVSERRAQQALQVVPEWVGVIALRNRGSLATVRRSASRVAQIVPLHQFEMLRTDEARRAVASSTGRVVDAPTGAAYPMLRQAFATLTAAEANRVVVNELRARSAGRRELLASPALPPSLRALAYAEPLSKIGERRLLATLATPLATFL